MCANSLSCVRLLATPWTVARQTPLSMGIFQARILEWVAVASPGDLPNPGIETTSLSSPALAGGFFTTSATWTECRKKLEAVVTGRRGGDGDAGVVEAAGPVWVLGPPMLHWGCSLIPNIFALLRGRRRQEGLL